VVVYQEVVLLIAEKESNVLTGYTTGPLTTGAIFEGGITCVGVVTVVSVFLQDVKNKKKNKPKAHRTFFIVEVLS